MKIVVAQIQIYYDRLYSFIIKMKTSDKLIIGLLGVCKWNYSNLVHTCYVKSSVFISLCIFINVQTSA